MIREEKSKYGIEGQHSAGFFLDFDLLRGMKAKVYQLARTISAHRPEAGKKFELEWAKE